MSKIENEIINKYKELLKTGDVDRILGWEKGIFEHDVTPKIFKENKSLKNFIYNEYCGSNLSKYLIEESKKEGKVLALLKPCDTYNYNELLLENRIKKDKIYVLGVPCEGMKDENGLLEKCKTCKGNEYKEYDELIQAKMTVPESKDRFELVEKIEKMSSEERFEFWRGELSKCIRCNACRNVCPACSCIQCVFDNKSSGFASKANSDSFEENMFHIIRAFHVAGRCTDCGECARVCPQDIPLDIINRKIIKDINDFYGEYQAGESAESTPPLGDYNLDDSEPSIINEKGGR